MFLLRASRGLSLKSPGVGQDAALGPVAKGTFGGSDLAAFLSWSSISSFLGSFVEASAGGGRLEERADGRRVGLCSHLVGASPASCQLPFTTPHFSLQGRDHVGELPWKLRSSF